MKLRFPWRLIRRISQLLFLAVFLFLFRNTDYSGSDEIPYAVNLFFRWDPLVAASVMLAARQFITILFPALIIVVLTLVFGRVFCGWICPLGTLLDIAGKFIKRHENVNIRLPYIKYVLLVIILVSSFFHLQLIGFFDPFSLLVRGMVFTIDPVFKFLSDSIFNLIYLHAPDWITSVSEPGYDFFKSFILPYKQSYFRLALISFVILLIIFLLEKIDRRFWCKNICPLGALLALFARYSTFRRKPVRICSKCTECETMCRMNAFDEKGFMVTEECNLCMDCLNDCPQKIVRFSFIRPRNRSPINFSRRAFIQSGLFGAAFPALSSVSIFNKVPQPNTLRPPGALPEKEFLSMCVRCGECMKVCIQNALQPQFMENGYEGMFAPSLLPRVGYCEFNCTLCGQVCPTGAIRKLSLREKHRFVIGKAIIDKNRCLPYAQNTPCIVCEEHCPTYDKAIKITYTIKNNSQGKPVELRLPYVVNNLCIGCGICEKKCPVQGHSAIRVISDRYIPDENMTGAGYG
ncbi:MAG: 4Fe-4S binding protein [Desulfobacterales bacterium]|nr:4Fe-4S binding protein [Desulfobacterales bacterium]